MLSKLSTLTDEREKQEMKERIAQNSPICEKSCTVDCKRTSLSEAEATVCYEV